MNPPVLTGTGAGAGLKSQLPDGVCSLPDVVGAVCKGLRLGGQAVSDAASSAVDSLVQSLIEGLGSCLRFDLAWWTNLPSPTLATSTGEPGPVLASVRGYTSGLQVLLLSAGIMFAAARLALAKRGGVAGEAQEAFLMFGRAVFASSTFAAVVTVGTRAGDAFSNWVIFDASRGDSNNASALLNGLSESGGLGSGVMLIIGVFGAISLLVQLVMLVVRQAFLILVVAALPIAAAAAGTGPGSQAYKRMLSWSLAFLLWKPVGALCYAIAFSAAGAKDTAQQQDPQMALLGLILLLMVAVVLPALMRLIAPVVATMGGGSGAAATLAGGLAGIAMGSAGGDRSEARKLGENDGAGGGGNPSQPPGPPGGGPQGGGRPMGTGSSSGGTTSGGTTGGGGAGSAPTTEAGSAAASTGGASSAGAAGGAAAGAGAAGMAVSAARSAHHGVQQAGSFVAPEARDTSESGADPDAPGPMEVRR